MTLSELIEKLQSVNDWLVDAENELTDAGDIPAFDRAHQLLEEQLEVIGDLQYQLEESEL